MCIGFFFGRWHWIGSEPLGLLLDWSLGPQGCHWIGFGGVHLGLILDWFWAGSCFLCSSKKDFARGEEQKDS